MLIIGFFRGRKRGMSKELLPLLKWVSLVLVCGFWYQMAAELLVNTRFVEPVAQLHFWLSASGARDCARVYVSQMASGQSPGR